MNREFLIMILGMVAMLVVLLAGLFAGATIEQLLLLVLCLFLGTLFAWGRTGGKKH